MSNFGFSSEDGSQWHQTEETCSRTSSRSSFTEEWVEVSELDRSFLIADKTGETPGKTFGDEHSKPSKTMSKNSDIAHPKHPRDHVSMDSHTANFQPHQAHEPDCSDGTSNCLNSEGDSSNGLSHCRTELQQKIHFARARVEQTGDEHQRAKQDLAYFEKILRLNESRFTRDCTCPQCISRRWLCDDALSGTTDAPTPAIVEDYLENAREAFVQHERLTELDLDFNEATKARLCNETSDADSPDEFEETYKRDRRVISEALAIAHYRLQARRDECLAQGIDPERFRYRRCSIGSG